MIYDYVQAFKFWIMLKFKKRSTRKGSCDDFLVAYLRYLVR